jgi:predicted anti-sigma-YlaC factor YlaD
MHDNDCDQIFAMLSEYLDQELAQANCADLEKHLKDCPPCITFVESFRRSVQLCRQLGEPAQCAPISTEQLDSLRDAYRAALARRTPGQWESEL